MWILRSPLSPFQPKVQAVQEVPAVPVVQEAQAIAQEVQATAQEAQEGQTTHSTPPLDIESVMATHGSRSPNENDRKRDAPERVVIGESLPGENSNMGAKRVRIQTEKIPDGTILIGNISHSAFAVDPDESGPSSFTDVV